ncbi:MAG TPA: hypothetical protein P5079_03620 [Elusimicrobiota bacterium]|nr:hypothetical protein [Elusimicrobiota bacterium]
METIIRIAHSVVALLGKLLGASWSFFTSDLFRQTVGFASDLFIVLAALAVIAAFFYYQWKTPNIRLKINIKERPKDRWPEPPPPNANRYSIAVALRNEGADIAKGMFFYLAFNEFIEVTDVVFFPDGIQNPTPGKAIFLYNHPHDLPNWSSWIEYFGVQIKIKKNPKQESYCIGRVDYQGGGEKRLKHNWIFFNPKEERFFFMPIHDLKKEMTLGIYKSDSHLE